MKNLLRPLVLVLMVGGAFAQSNLPACQGSDTTKWSNCTGGATLSNGRYVGEYKDGKRNGRGTATFVSGHKYVGEFKDEKYNGQGTLTFPDGNKYVGEFKDGLRNGKGTSTFASGEMYVGEFKDDKYNGEGTLYSLNGSIINQGIWADNTFVRSATVQQATTPNTELEKRSNFPTCPASGYFHLCFGTVTYPYGNKYSGEWKDGKRNGEGTLYSKNGIIYSQGIWVDDYFVGAAPVQQAPVPTTELEKLRSEAELERKRRHELEEQLRLAQQQPQTSTQTATPPSIGRRVALVLGNANYKVRPLKNPRNDADDISRSLRSSGFEVIDLRDASLQQMRNGVRQFGDRLINNDVGLVYYSGHGIEVKGRNYFIPVNADIMREDEIADQGLDVSLILEKMNTAGKGVNILIVDACRDDPFGRSFRSSSRGLAQMDAPRGTIIAYATSPGKVASDGDPRERNSPYTKNLVKAMQQPNKPIEQVFKEVRRAVQEETKNQQTPWENTSLSGDFYFRVQR